MANGKYDATMKNNKLKKIMEQEEKLAAAVASNLGQLLFWREYEEYVELM